MADYETPLSPKEETAFQQWKSKYAPHDSGADYDLRGAFKAGLTPDSERGHLPDTFKKPNHPTFSDQSQYSKGDTVGGRWSEQDGKTTFTPSTWNLKTTSADKLQDYFKRVEPEATLKLSDNSSPNSKSGRAVIQAQSADGVLHEFPDGTDHAVIDRVMKTYAMQKPGMSKLKAQMADKAGFGEQVTYGAGAPVKGLGQDVIHALPQPALNAIAGIHNAFSDNKIAITPEGADSVVRQRAEEMKAKGVSETSPGYIAGNLLTTLPLAALSAPVAALAGGGTLAGLAGAGLAGAVSGALEPVTTKGGFAAEKAEQGGLGAVTGALGQAVGKIAGAVIKPTFKKAQQLLIDAGVRLTPGQMAGGVGKSTEDLAKSIPGFRDAVSMGERTSLESFNVAAANKALEPIGIKLPKGIKAGEDAMEAGQDALDTAYDKVKTKIGQVHLDKDMVDGFKNLSSLVDEMPPDQKTQFTAIMNNRVGQRFGQQGVIDGDTFKLIDHDLRVAASNARRNPLQTELGYALREARSVLRDGVKRQNPAAKADLDAVDKAYSAFSVVQDASIRRPTSLGVFTPSDLLQEIKTNATKSGNRRSLAKGDQFLQEFAKAGQEVLPSKIPDSGTGIRIAGNGLLKALVGGATGAAAVEHPLITGATIAAGLAAAAPYTSPGMAFMEKYATGLPATRNYLAKIVREGGRYLAPGFGSGAGAAVNALSGP